MEQNIFQKTIQESIKSIKYQTEQITATAEAQVLLSGVDLSDVHYINCTSYDNFLRVCLTLKEDRQDSKLVHKIAQALGVSFTKEKSDWNESLIATATKDNEYSIVIENYVPATCEIIEYEQPLTPEEIEQARQAVPVVRKIRKVICSDAS